MTPYLEEISGSDDPVELMLACKVFEKLLPTSRPWTIVCALSFWRSFFPNRVWRRQGKQVWGWREATKVSSEGSWSSSVRCGSVQGILQSKGKGEGQGRIRSRPIPFPSLYDAFVCHCSADYIERDSSNTAGGPADQLYNWQSSPLLSSGALRHGTVPSRARASLQLKFYLEPQTLFQLEQEKVVKFLQLVLDDGKEFTSNLKAGYRRLLMAKAFFTTGLDFANRLLDPTLKRDWVIRLLDQACPCYELAQSWKSLAHVSKPVCFFFHKWICLFFKLRLVCTDVHWAWSHKSANL